jgi:histidinol dehydrogenase
MSAAAGQRPVSAMAADIARARRGGAFGPRERAVAARVIAAVRRDGDASVLRVVREFDRRQARASDLVADRATLRRVARRAAPEVRRALDLAYRRIRRFHEEQRPRAAAVRDADGTLRLTPAPLGRVGALVPRGATAYPSTALMTGIPARVAGVPALVAASPMTADGEIDPALAYALTLVDADALYRAGGAAAVAALAYGTKLVAPVDKIVGPGNAYATAAKWLVSADVGIDALQGPSELVIVAAGGADPSALALDLLAQAEHGSGAFAALVSDDAALLREVRAALARGAGTRGADGQLARRMFLYRAPSIRAAARAANEAAAEHVLLAGSAAAALARLIERAGAVFIGERSAVAFGDYVAGTNHCLPTGGTARWSSALRVDDFVRWTSRVELRPRAGRLSAAGAVIARQERMRYHAESMEARG